MIRKKVDVLHLLYTGYRLRIRIFTQKSVHFPGLCCKNITPDMRSRRITGNCDVDSAKHGVGTSGRRDTNQIRRSS